MEAVVSNQQILDEDYDRHWKMLWNVQLAIRYHMHLQNYYLRFGKFVTAFTLILSTSAGATLFGSNVELAKYLAFTAAVLQVLELVIDSKAKTTLHTNLRQRYIQLESELAENDNMDKTNFAPFKAKIAMLEVDEPPIIFSLMDECHNELVKVHNLGDSELNKIPFVKLFIAWWYK